MGKKLTEKERLFCQEYIIDFNAARAAKSAGYKEKSAREIGSQNLTKLHIIDFLAELKGDRSEKLGIKAEEVLAELRNFAYSDITETLTLTTEQIKELPPPVRRLITQYKKVTRRIGEEGEIFEEFIELKFIDKLKAFEMINKHIGLYEADNRQSQANITMFRLPENGR